MMVNCKLAATSTPTPFVVVDLYVHVHVHQQSEILDPYTRRLHLEITIHVRPHLGPLQFLSPEGIPIRVSGWFLSLNVLLLIHRQCTAS